MLSDMGKKARTAARVLSHCSAEQKNAILESLANNILSQSEHILAANREDIEEGVGLRVLLHCVRCKTVGS